MKNEPAFPLGHVEYISCLTKREYFAAMAMQGHISYMADWNVIDPFRLAEKAVRNADALIAELQKEKE